MSLKATCLCLGTPRIGEPTLRKFVSIFSQCGITGHEVSPPPPSSAPVSSSRSTLSSAGLPTSASDLESNPRFAAFAPLFTPYFHFNNQQLTTFGDILIDEYLSEMMLQYCGHAGLLLTVNATKQLNAVFHNHFALRLFANELGFEELAIPVGEDMNVATTMHATLDFLEAQRLELHKRDTAGTSFYTAPLQCAQSPLGWKFSHFVGAVHTVYGPAATRAVLEKVYGLTGTSNFPHCATSLLLRVLDHFPAPNVAEALLAAQGLAMRFVGKTRVLPEPPGEETKQASGTEAESGGTDSGAAARAHDTGILVLSGFGPSNNPFAAAAANVSLDELAGSAQLRTSLAEGPGGVDSVDRWRKRTNTLVEAKVEPALEENMEDGWLTPEEQSWYKRGPAFSRAVDFSLHRSYADEYGPPQPVDGKRVGKIRFKKPVRDPLFYDKLSDRRNGVPFSTDGEPLPNYLDRFYRPHKRLFEVTVLAGAGEGRVVGRAIAGRYTVAREAACRAFLGGVLKDISTVTELYGQQS